jgi:dTDP-4-amino-4,6-dideoxygalactose transaminase
VSIPLLDLGAQHASIRSELDEAIAAVLADGKFVSGPEVGRFENAFAEYCGSSDAIGVSSGTSALTLGLRAAGVKAGDEVITSAMTFIATAESIVEAGARPVLVDPSLGTGLVEADSVAAAITDRTSAIVVVHLWGQPVDLTVFRQLADNHKLILAEDAAQAHGAEWAGSKAGSVGDFGAFSFYPGKNLGCLGDGGAVTTSDAELAGKVRSLRDHGRVDKYRHDVLGTNARLDTLQAAVLDVKLRHLENWNEARRAHAGAYDEAFAGVEEAEPITIRPEATPVYHQYVVRVPARDAAMEALRAEGIGAGAHYPIPLNRQPALESLVTPDGFPAADRLGDEVLSLPVFSELTPEQRDTVVSAVSEQVKSKALAGNAG